MVYKTALERAAKLAADVAKRIAAKKKAGTYVKPKGSVKQSFNELQLIKVNKELAADRGKGATNALLKKKQNFTGKVKADLAAKGEKFNSVKYEKFNKGGAVNKNKSCGKALRGHGKVIK